MSPPLSDKNLNKLSLTEKHNKIRKGSLQRSVQILRGEDDQQKERPGEKEVKKLTRQDMKSNQDS